MKETAAKKEKYILVGIGSREEDIVSSLEELRELVKTAGADTVLMIPQVRQTPHPKTYVGTGKVEEIKAQLEYFEADGIVFDDELSPTQMNNLEQLLQTKIMDRTMVILDIFASHARSAEGKIQVELAQLQYRATHLIGMGKILSRLGGGIGTRGPGEKKLEIDRRRIHDRISILKKKLKEVEKHRQVTRKRRSENGILNIAIVGYTNAGKSTLLNTLTHADILAADMLFATLDPTTRELYIPGAGKVLITDTVGFIRKLPHNLIEAFKSTLEEAVWADIILHVADASDPDLDAHMITVYDTLQELQIKGKPIITIFNKCDLIEEDAFFSDIKANKVVNCSAKTGQGLSELKDIILNYGKEL